jgi:hypothetical protein
MTFKRLRTWFGLGGADLNSHRDFRGDRHRHFLLSQSGDNPLDLPDRVFGALSQ